MKFVYRRERGVVSEIRNQGLCGACWAHSVIGTVESMMAIERNSSTLELSVQQMIDCAANNNGITINITFIREKNTYLTQHYKAVLAGTHVICLNGLYRKRLAFRQWQRIQQITLIHSVKC